MKKLMRGLLRLLGWKATGDMPDIDKCVIVFAPHTSNWDFFYMLIYRYSQKMTPAFLAKDALFSWPIGWFFRGLGGIPVRRDAKHNLVDSVVKVIKERNVVHLALAPEGTRSKTDNWRSGFYHIAMGAGVPLVLAYLDKSTRQLGIGPTLEPTGDMQADLQVIREFYADKEAIYPAKVSDIRIAR